MSWKHLCEFNSQQGFKKKEIKKKNVKKKVFK